MAPRPEELATEKWSRRNRSSLDDSDGDPEEDLAQHLSGWGEGSGGHLWAGSGDATNWPPIEEWEAGEGKDAVVGKSLATRTPPQALIAGSSAKHGRPLSKEERELGSAKTSAKAGRKDRKQEKAE